MPDKVRRRGRHHPKREDILAAAERILVKRGYDQTAVDDIARELGCTKGLIYYHFRSKAELFFEMRIAVIRGISQYVKQADVRIEDPKQRLWAAMVAHAEWVCSHGSKAALPMTIEVRASPLFPEEFRGQILEARHRLQQWIEDLARQVAQVEGIRKFDPGLFTRTFLNAANSISLWYSPEGPLTAREVAVAMVNFFFNGINAQTSDGVAATPLGESDIVSRLTSH